MLRELWSHKRALLVGALVCIVPAVYSIYAVAAVLPPKLVKRDLQYSAASVEVYVDSPVSFTGAVTQPAADDIQRAVIFANVMASPGGMDLVGSYAGIPGNQIWAAGPVDPTQERVVVEPTATKRSYQVAGEALPYRIELLADPTLPTISIYTQAPTTSQAVALANGTVSALRAYLAEQETAQRVPPSARTVIRSIGPAHGAIVNGGIAKKLAGMVFVASFVLWCVLILGAVRIHAAWRRAGAIAGAREIVAGGRR